MLGERAMTWERESRAARQMCVRDVIRIFVLV